MVVCLGVVYEYEYFLIIIDDTLVINMKFIIRERERCATGERERCTAGERRGARTAPPDMGGGLDLRSKRWEVRSKRTAGRK
jgi:hypothetical protein